MECDSLKVMGQPTNISSWTPLVCPLFIPACWRQHPFSIGCFLHQNRWDSFHNCILVLHKSKWHQLNICEDYCGGIGYPYHYHYGDDQGVIQEKVRAILQQGCEDCAAQAQARLCPRCLSHVQSRAQIEHR